MEVDLSVKVDLCVLGCSRSYPVSCDEAHNNRPDTHRKGWRSRHQTRKDELEK